MKTGELSVHLKIVVAGTLTAVALALGGCGKKDDARFNDGEFQFADGNIDMIR